MLATCNKKKRTSNQRVVTTMQCCMVLWSQMQLSRCVWFCGCCCHATCGVAGTVVRLGYVIVAVAMPRAVSRLLLSHHVVLLSQSRHVWCYGYSCCTVCCGCCRRTMHGVVGTVVRLHYVMVMVAMPHVVSWSQLSCCVVLSLWSRYVWCRGHSRGGCHCAAGAAAVVIIMVALSLWLVVAPWQALEGEDGCTSVGKDGSESTVTGLQKKKLAEKDKRKPTRRG